MKQIKDLYKAILNEGQDVPNRTGIPTRSITGHMMRFDLKSGFPLVTTKKVAFNQVIHELLWFLKGDTNIKYLIDNGVHIWDAWADRDGNLGPIYGKQWTAWPVSKRLKPEYQEQSDEYYFKYEGCSCHIAPPCGGCVHEGNPANLAENEDAWTDSVNQIEQVVHSLSTDPFSRRHIVSAWNVAEIDQMALAPCHCLFQFTVTSKRELNCVIYQRSCDSFLGVPYNVASYALLTHMMAQVTNLLPGTLVWMGGDVHLYHNHCSQVEEQLQRHTYPLPKLRLNPGITNIFDFTIDDILLTNYKCHPPIKAPVAV